MSFSLTDDGTLDTVIRCDECGEEMRFNYDIAMPEGTDQDQPDREQAALDAYDAFVDECIEQCEADHDCDQEALGPQEGDITTKDHRTFYQDGRVAFTLEETPAGTFWLVSSRHRSTGTANQEFVSIEQAIQAYMAASQYWPNCWFISDHGNAHLMTLDQTESQS